MVARPPALYIEMLMFDTHLGFSLPVLVTTLQGGQSGLKYPIPPVYEAQQIKGVRASLFIQALSVAADVMDVSVGYELSDDGVNWPTSTTQPTFFTTSVIGLSRAVSSSGVVDSTPLTMLGFDFLLTSSTPFEPGYIYAVAYHWFREPDGTYSWVPSIFAWQALDPDPVRLQLDGTYYWRVYFGVQDDMAIIPDPAVVSEPTFTGTHALLEEDDDGSDV